MSEIHSLMKVQRYPQEDLLQRLYQVPLMEQPEIKPYKTAHITLESIHTDYLSPPQTYLWIKELHKVQTLRWLLLEKDVDIFRLDGFVSYTIKYTDGREVKYDMYPPVIEESIESDGSLHAIINDGMHRVYLARQEWIIPQVVYIRGIPKSHPYYAFPLVNGWKDVEILETNPNPETFMKKYHRIQKNKQLYRHFQAVFQNVGGSRTTS